MLHLRILGTFDLRGGNEALARVLAQPKRAALFVYLVLARPRGYHRRDTLLALFWPELDAARARNSLSQALSFLRRELGDDVVVNRGAGEVGVQLAVRCDALDFEAAIATRRWEEALSLYAGDLLPGVHVEGADFDRWLDAERLRLRELAAAAAWSCAHDLLARNDLAGSERAARVALRLGAANEQAPREYMHALAAAGDRAAALGFYGALAEHLAKEVEVEPDAETRVLVDSIRRGAVPAAPRDVAVARPVSGIRGSGGDEADVPTSGDHRNADRATAARSHRAGRRAAAAASAVLFVLTAWMLRPGSAVSPRPPASDEAVAVLPFEVQGTYASEFLGEALTSLLSAKLEGATGLRPVDPRALLGLLERDGASHDADGRARLAVTQLGAASYITGTVVEAGGRLHIAASLYRADGRREAQAAVEGATDDLFRLVDELAARLLASRLADPLADVAAATTHSLPALKAWVAGERALREARYEAARRHFVAAIEADSTFALAYYRYTIACDWAGGCASRWTTQAGERYADRLPPHARSLFRASLAWSRRQNDEAERLYRTAVNARPEDTEAWFQLGEVLFHTGPFRGRPIAESREPWLKLLELQPENHFAVGHLAVLASIEYDAAALSQYTALAVRSAADAGTPAPLQLEVLDAITRADTAAQQRLLRAMRAIPEMRLRNEVWGIAAYARDLEAGKRFARLLLEPAHPEYVHRLGRLALAHIEIAGGRVRAGFAQIDSLARSEPAMATAYAALLRASAISPASAVELEAVRRRLLDWSPGDSNYFALATNGRFHAGDLPAIRAYLLGLVALKAGDTAEARRRVDELGRLATAASAPLIPDLRAGLHARILAEAGEREQALTVLESLDYDRIPRIVALYHDFAALTGERFLRASLLEDLGRDTEALNAYRSVIDSSPLRLPYLAPTLLARARIHERRGEREQAATLYRRVLDLWRDADPALEAIARRIEPRAGRLAAAPATPLSR